MEENLLAVDVWNKIQAAGSEFTWGMMDLTLTRDQAEDLLEKLAFIAGVIRQWEAEKAKQEK